ncbi:MAG: radical SAM protein [Nanoarchaeota archaeon]|nr:radical SAM protein [Nanoarchaeota archaeon]
MKSIVLDDKFYLAVLFAGCNFRCRYCFNSSILEFKNEFLKNIMEVKKTISASDFNGVLFAGAEPCIQRQALISLARFSKKKNKQVAVFTNCSRPDSLRSLIIEQLVDRIYIDIKSPFSKSFERVTNSRTYFKEPEQIIADMKETFELLRNSDVTVIARTTIIPSLMYRKDDIIKIAKLVHSLECNWELQHYIPGISLDKKIQNIRPFTKSFLNTLKEICLKEFPDMEIGIV